MSSPPPSALPYEPLRHDALDPLWAALRAGLVLWAFAIVLRHAFYWTMVASSVTPAVVGALGEVVALAAIAVVALRNREPTPAVLGLLGGLGFAMIGLAILGFGVEYFAMTGFVAGTNRFSPGRLGWLLAGRAATIAIPVMLIVASRAGRR